MNSENIKMSAGILALNRIKKQQLKEIPDKLKPKNIDDAYKVQEQMHNLFQEINFGRRIGYKIGCTSPVMRQYLGINEPCYGGILNTGTNYISANKKFEDFVMPGVEIELAVFTNEDLIFHNETTINEIPVDKLTIFPAIEIVDNRWINYKNVDINSLIADDFFSSEIILGNPVSLSKINNLDNLSGILSINNKQISDGNTKSIMNHPLNALIWLINSLQKKDKFLKQGEIVMLGSITQTKWVDKNDEIIASFSSLGDVMLKFT
ncbi:MAG: hypothetical protein CL774_02285 [Chloroflexi bacterium]|nr:hypothetical protein [Chloroflexota bacterium]